MVDVADVLKSPADHSGRLLRLRGYLDLNGFFCDEPFSTLGDWNGHCLEFGCPGVAPVTSDECVYRSPEGWVDRHGPHVAERVLVTCRVGIWIDPQTNAEMVMLHDMRSLDLKP